MSISPTTIDPYVQVGRSGLTVYRVGLGTMQFGWRIDEATSFEVLDAYVAAGGNFIDTADCYTAWSANQGGPANAGGVSEEIIGRWLTSRGIRNEMVVATKVRAPMGEFLADTRATRRNREGLSRRWINQACEDSLRRLQVDHIDLYQAHFIDPLTPIEETLSAFTDLVRRGLVRYIGVSNFSAWRLMQALWTADRRDLESIVSIQPNYNLLPETRRNFETEIAMVCEHYGLGVLPYGPLAGGVLTGGYRLGAPLPDTPRAPEKSELLTPENDTVIGVLIDVAAQAGMTPAQAALAWLRAQPTVTAPLVGANSVEQLTTCLEGLDRELSPDQLATLDQASDWSRPRTHLED